MTSKRLIELLQMADPDGTEEVAIYLPDEDYFCGIINIDQCVKGGGVHLHAGDLADQII